MSSAEASSEISPRELERDQLKKRLEKLASSSFDSSSATPRPAEPTKISTQTFVDSHEQLLRNIEQYGDVLFDMLPDKEAFQNDPRYIIQDEEGEITHEGMLYLAEQIIAIIQEHGLINGIDQDHPGFASVAESFIPENDQRATLDAVTALQILGVGSVINRLTELYKPETHNYITTHATGLNRRSVRTGYAPRRDGITLSDRYTNVFEVNKTNTITIDGKQVTYDKVNATLLSKPAEFYDLFEKINSHVEVTDDMVKRLLTYVGSKINSPDFWNVRDDEDKAEMQLLLSQLEAATENKEKKRLFGTVINRLFKNNDISVELAAMTSGGDVLAAGMPVQNRMQEWGRIVFGNETRGADQETTAMSREATIDLRSAQALFNILIPPEQLKELYILDHEIAILRKPYDDEIAKANAISEAADRKKELEDIYKRMHRDQQLNEKIAAKTDMRTSFYDAILTAYNVEEPDGSKTGTTVDNPFIDAIRERKKLLKGNTWNDINDKSKTELMASLDDHNDPDGDIRRAIMRGHYNTTNSLDRLTKRFGSDFIRNNRAGNDIVVSMGLKGIELLKRRAKTERKIIPETIEHDLKAIMERTVPAEVTVYGRVEEGAQPEQPDEQLTQLLEKLKGSTEQEDDTPSDLPVEDEQPVTNTAQLGEGDKLKNKASVSDAAETPQPSSNEVVEMAILYEKQYHKLPQSESIEATAAIEAAVGLLSEGNRDESIDWFRRALEHDPSSLQAMYGIAVTSPDVAEQTAMLEHILRQQPDFKVARLLLSNLQNEPSEQQPTGETDLTALHIEIAQLMQEMRITDARAKARELTEKHPTDAEGWYLRGILHPEIKLQKKYFRTALKHDPNHTLAKQALASLEEQSDKVSTSDKNSDKRHSFLKRIVKIEQNEAIIMDQADLQQISPPLTDWLDKTINERLLQQLLSDVQSDDPASAQNSAIRDLQRHIERVAENYADYAVSDLGWPANKRKENIKRVTGVILYELKQRVDQYRQTNSEKPPAENASHNDIEVKLREISADEQQYTGFAAEIAQHFWQSNREQIKVYVDAGAAILSVDTSTMDRQEQLQAEGVKFAYLNILNQSISQRAQIKLFIEHGNNHTMIESLVRVLQEDLSLLSPEQIVDTHNVSPRLYGVAAKSEIVDLLLKLARPSAKKTALALLAPGQPLRDALDSLRTISPTSASGTVIGDLERDLPQTITSLYNVLELESSEGRETISEEDIIEAAKRLYSSYIEQLTEMAKSGNAAEFWNLFDHTVVNLHVFMKGDQLTRGWQKTKAPITKEHVEKAILTLLGSDNVKVPERPSLEDTPKAPEKQQEVTVAQAEEVIMTSGLLTDNDIQELQRSDDYQKDLTTSVNVIYELLKGKQQLDVIENNIVFSKKIIREAIDQIVSKTPTRIRELNDGEPHRNIPELIDTSAEDTPHDIEQTITVLQTLGYTENRIAELMQNGRQDFLNLETHSIMQSLEQAHRKHIIDADIYPSKSELMEALKEMIRRHSEKTTSGQVDSEVNAEKTEQIMDLETTIDTLREHGKVSDAALDILSLNPTDRLLQVEIDFILTQSILPMLRAAKRNGAIPPHLVFTHSSLSDALHEMVKRRKEYKSKEEQSQS